MWSSPTSIFENVSNQHRDIIDVTLPTRQLGVALDRWMGLQWKIPVSKMDHWGSSPLSETFHIFRWDDPEKTPNDKTRNERMRARVLEVSVVFTPGDV